MIGLKDAGPATNNTSLYLTRTSTRPDAALAYAWLKSGYVLSFTVRTGSTVAEALGDKAKLSGFNSKSWVENFKRTVLKIF